MKSSLDLEHASDKRRLLLMALVLLLPVVIVAPILLWVTHDQEQVDAPVQVSVPLTEDDREQLEHLAKSSITRQGTWGLREGAITEKNGLLADSAIKTGDPQLASSFWNDRRDVYGDFRMELHDSSPLWYEYAEYSSWGDTPARDQLMSLEVKGEPEVQVPEEGRMNALGGEEVPFVEVPVSFTERLTTYVAGSDTEWDGSTFWKSSGEEIVTATMQAAKGSDGLWRIYDFKQLSNPTVMAFWDSTGAEAPTLKNPLEIQGEKKFGSQERQDELE